MACPGATGGQSRRRRWAWVVAVAVPALARLRPSLPQSHFPAGSRGPVSLDPVPQRDTIPCAKELVGDQNAESGAHVVDEFAVAGRCRISCMHWPTPQSPHANVA